MTLEEVAIALRCSKAHVCNLINGKVRGARPLPALRLGRRKLVRRSSLEEWISSNERMSA
jgi:excisionase family DNA binding protein